MILKGNMMKRGLRCRISGIRPTLAPSMPKIGHGHEHARARAPWWWTSDPVGGSNPGIMLHKLEAATNRKSVPTKGQIIPGLGPSPLP